MSEIKYRKSQSDTKHMVSKRPYSGNIPAELEPYHYFMADAGHCIMCVLKCHLEEAAQASMDDYELPVPVKYVLTHSWRKEGDYIIIDAPYELPLGLILDDEYFEF